MVRTVAEALEYMEDHDVKFIKLQFCDIFGVLKNISIVPSQLPRAFESGIGFDASSIGGFLNVEESDLFLYPDPTTLCLLPWRPQQGKVARLFCDIRRPDGSPFEGDSRGILKRMAKQVAEQGYSLQIGPECEFYLFETDSEGRPLLRPHDNAGYFDVAPHDRGENTRREICLTLEEMGLVVQNSHHACGPGQHQIDFKYAEAVTAADNFITFKAVVKSIARKNGLFASFLPKPLTGCAGSGLHVNLSLQKDGKNIFAGEPGQLLSPQAMHFIGGVMEHVRGFTAITNPLINSYKRFGAGFQAPSEISWSHLNRSYLLRIPAAVGERTRIELRSPDPACNPYLAFALIMAAGFGGLEAQAAAPQPGCEMDGTCPALPASLPEALACMEQDPLVRQVLGSHIVDNYSKTKKAECADYHNTVHPWEIERYFEVI